MSLTKNAMPSLPPKPPLQFSDSLFLANICDLQWPLTPCINLAEHQSRISGRSGHECRSLHTLSSFLDYIILANCQSPPTLWKETSLHLKPFYIQSKQGEVRNSNIEYTVAGRICREGGHKVKRLQKQLKRMV